MVKIAIIQMNGCNKCFNETIKLAQYNYDISRFKSKSDWDDKKYDYVILTGYLTQDDGAIIKRISQKSRKMIGYGTCTTTGGIYGLSYQKGNEISKISKLDEDARLIHGCLADVENLHDELKERPRENPGNLCATCKRKSSCSFLLEVKRQIEYDEESTECFNDKGYLCSGYVSGICKERCIDYNTPCRGCVPNVESPSLRMMGLFGTLLGNVDVATEASSKGATDKLADKPDEITEYLPDIAGNFFRFHLSDTPLPIGKKPSTHNIVSDIFNERLIEEIPLIAGMMGGDQAISLTLDIVDAYEQGSTLEVNETTRKLRKKLRRLETDYNNAVEQCNYKNYIKITDEIRKLAGNMNLSNVFFGGFKTPIKGIGDFQEYRTTVFQPQSGQYTGRLVSYTLNEKGVVSNFQMEAI